MKAQNVKKKDLEQIHNVACKDWKLKIEQYAQRNLFDDEIQLTGSEIEEMFAASTPKQKKVLDKLFVREKSSIDKIKTFADACIECGTTEKEFNDKLPEQSLAVHIISMMKLEIIVKAFNGEWVPDWEDSNEYKYYPYFKMSPFGFGGAFYGVWFTGSSSGSRLCFKNRKLAEYAGKQFEDIYKEFIVS